MSKRVGEASVRPLRIGLTGPIGCGKSTVAHWLADGRGTVIDADDVAREVTALGEPGLAAIIDHFGNEYRRADGSLDRAALGRRVFGDPIALGELERIVHPLVRPRILAALDRAAAHGDEVVVIEAIKLVESGYGPLCDEVWLVTCPPDDQQRRLVGRGLSPSDARQRSDAQAGMSERLSRAATRILDTAGSIDKVRERVGRERDDAFARRGAAT